MDMDTRKMRPILESFHYPILDFLVLVIMMTTQLQKSFIEKYDLLHDGCHTGSSRSRLYLPRLMLCDPCSLLRRIKTNPRPMSRLPPLTSLCTPRPHRPLLIATSESWSCRIFADLVTHFEIWAGAS